MTKSYEHEVLVVGAGPAGSAVGYFLASNDIDVVLLDKSEFPRDKTCGDALSPRALHVLKSMGLAEAVQQAGCRIEKVSFFAPDGNTITVGIPEAGELPSYCVILKRYDFDSLLCKHAVDAGADFRGGTRVTGLIREGDRVVGVRGVGTDGIFELRARFVVLATGAATALLINGGIVGKMPDHYIAARTYYERVQGLTDAIEFHYDDVPIPGYGWIFPLSTTSANVGVGYTAVTGRKSGNATQKEVFRRFVANRRLASMLDGADCLGPVKGYPIRVDFPSVVPAYPGLLLIGEACGLVNPLSGEGIDYALESAELVSDILIGRSRSPMSLKNDVEEEYTRHLKSRFLKGFRELIRVRDLYMRRFMLNRYVSAAVRNEGIARLLVNVGLGNLSPRKAISLKNLIQIALG